MLKKTIKRQSDQLHRHLVTHLRATNYTAILSHTYKRPTTQPSCHTPTSDQLHSHLVTHLRATNYTAILSHTYERSTTQPSCHKPTSDQLHSHLVTHLRATNYTAILSHTYEMIMMTMMDCSTQAINHTVRFYGFERVKEVFHWHIGRWLFVWTIKTNAQPRNTH